MSTAALSTKGGLLVSLFMPCLSEIAGTRNTLPRVGEDVETQSESIALQDNQPPDGGLEGWLTVLGV